MNWWKRFKPARHSLLPAMLSTALCTVLLLLLWVPEQRPTAIMQQYGTSLAATIAHATSGQLLNQNQIELAVIATDIVDYPEVSGVVFYDPQQNVLAMAGEQKINHDFTARASLNDTYTGYVSLTLDPAAFMPAQPLIPWMGTLLVLLGVPLLVVFGIQLSQRGNRSLPIVSVPEPQADEAQQSYCLTLNLYNALALGRQGSETALKDALLMAQEVCAVYPGFATIANSRGVLLLFDRNTVSARQAICAGFLLLELLNDYETAGEFRGYLQTCTSPQSPAEMTSLDLKSLEGIDFEHTLTLAALARPRALLSSDHIQQALAGNDGEQQNDPGSDWLTAFAHPMLEEDEHLFTTHALPDAQANLVASQKTVILGFSPSQD